MRALIKISVKKVFGHIMNISYIMFNFVNIDYLYFTKNKF